MGLTPSAIEFSVIGPEVPGVIANVAYIGVDEKCKTGIVYTNGIANKSLCAQMTTDEYGGSFGVFGKGSDEVGAQMCVDKGGNGLVIVSGADKSLCAQMTTGEYGGRFIAFGKGSSKGQAEMLVDEYGGSFNVYGKGSDKTRVRMSVNEYGNGAIGLWDKNGYRLK